jgi:hypothetical protein
MQGIQIFVNYNRHRTRSDGMGCDDGHKYINLSREIQEQYYRGLEHRYSCQWDHWNDILHQHENLVTLAEAAVITAIVQEELAIGIQDV